MNSSEMNEAYGQGQGADGERSESLKERISNLEKEIDDVDESHHWDVLAHAIHPINVEKGFWEPPVLMDKYVAKMMLVVTETAEVVEALRKSQGKDKVTEEFADIFIRALDLYGKLVEDGEANPALYGVLIEKLEVNRNRAPKHGNRWG